MGIAVVAVAAVVLSFVVIVVLLLEDPLSRRQGVTDARDDGRRTKEGMKEGPSD